MRAYSWIAFGTLALACGGSAFTANDAGGGGTATNGGTDAATSGESGTGRAGRNSGGSVSSGGSSTGVAGDMSVGGLISVGGDPGVGGDVAVGGSPPVAGTTSTAGTTGTAGTSTAGSSGTGGTGPDPIDKVCPKTQPIKGGACTDGLNCSYGTDVRTACRPLAKCSGGVWAITKPSCETLSACEGVQPNAACDGSAKPCMLAGDQGTYCVCSGCTAVGGPCSSQTSWACAGGSGGPLCPTLPPNLGASCTGARSCEYGSCSTGNGVNAVCDGTTWAWHGMVCPL